jgi:hypothetical protein
MVNSESPLDEQSPTFLWNELIFDIDNDEHDDGHGDERGDEHADEHSDEWEEEDDDIGDGSGGGNDRSTKYVEYRCLLRSLQLTGRGEPIVVAGRSRGLTERIVTDFLVRRRYTNRLVRRWIFPPSTKKDHEPKIDKDHDHDDKDGKDHELKDDDEDHERKDEPNMGSHDVDDHVDTNDGEGVEYEFVPLEDDASGVLYRPPQEHKPLFANEDLQEYVESRLFFLRPPKEDDDELNVQEREKELNWRQEYLVHQMTDLLDRMIETQLGGKEGPVSWMDVLTHAEDLFPELSPPNNPHQLFNLHPKFQIISSKKTKK